MNQALLFGIPAILGSLVLLLIWRSRMADKNYQECFSRVFGSLARPPKFKSARSYGFPQFTVTFETRQDLNRAKSEGLTKEFSNLIEALCSDSGSPGNQFDVTRAIWFTSDEEISEIQERARRLATKDR